MKTNLPLRMIGSTGLNATLIGFGALEIGRDWGLGTEAERARPASVQAGETLNEVLDLGVNLIDTASAYHRSEQRIGTFLEERRHSFILATKCGEHNDEPSTYYDFSYEAIWRSIDTSLKLLETNVIDILQIHFGPEPDKVLDDGGCVRAMKEAVEKGIVRHLGASVDGPVLDRCIESGDFEVVQVAYSLMNQDQAPLIKKAHARGIGVLIRSGLGAGWLTPNALRVEAKDRPAKVNALLDLCGGNAELLYALSLHFLAANEAVSSILVGSKSAAKIGRAIEVVQMPVDQKLLEKAIGIGA